MNAIRGEVGIEIGGVPRTLVCDMNAAEALFQALGPHWLLWLHERFVGKPDKLADGTKIRRLEPLSPRDLVIALHGMLAEDRRRSGSMETIAGLAAAIGPFAFTELQMALTRAVMASLGVPGEVREAVPGAVAEPPKEHGSEPAAMPGTGAQP